MAIALRDFNWVEKKALIERISTRYDGNDDYLLETIGIIAEDHEEELYNCITKQYSAKLQKATGHWVKAYARLVWRLHPVSAVPQLKAWILNTSIPITEAQAGHDCPGLHQGWQGRKNDADTFRLFKQNHCRSGKILVSIQAGK